ncbi:gasdermin-A [Trichosurus vulpecula]|uniref:gasdermin-A n=1 Tax=Trichosurus vulpecula TaxID=9337 RepID=UPI00186ACFD5|nr:gasdermin-A [Trichosurus vulpecula]
MTMFENVTRALARQLNPRGDLTPLDSLIDFKRFHPFCLVLRKRKSTLFWGARYVRTDYTLLDLLQPGTSPSDPSDTGNFSFKNLLDARLEGEVDVPKTVKVKGTAGLSHSSTLEVQSLSVSPKALDNLQKERKLMPEHSFLKEIKERGENLYVVMEVVETVKEITLENAGKASGCFSLPFFAPLGLQGSIDHKEAITIPKGCVLAFRVRQLVIKGKDDWDIPHVSNENLKTFPTDGESSGEVNCLLFFSAYTAEVPESFGSLKKEVQSEAQEVDKLSREGQASLLKSLRSLLGKKQDLQDLELSFEEALNKRHPVSLEASPKDIELSHDVVEGILYFLGALTELTEAQHKLLAKSMDMKILPLQLRLVESVMEQNFPCTEEGLFPLKPELLSSLGDEELTFTEALVGLSGLEMQRSGLKYNWDPDTLPQLCALYASLSFLQLLTKDS